MTLYDPESKRLVLRIVYDGPACAGKTTNLASICTQFSTRRRSEMYAARTVGERTLYLDWLEVQGGSVAGHPVACHFMTVPGQAVLSRRRLFLMKKADALVFVLNSTPRGIAEAKSMFALSKAFAEAHQIALLVQANKQDLPGAVGALELAQSLKILPSTVIAAQAGTGQGVKQTAIAAIRAASDHARENLAHEGIEKFTEIPLTGEQLVHAMIEFDKADPRSRIQRVMDEAQSRSSPSAPASELATRTSRQEGELVIADTPLTHNSKPVLPLHEAPTGGIWPSTTGRKLLRSIPLDKAQRVDNGLSPFVLYRAEHWALRTSSRHCYDDVAEGQRDLLVLARRKKTMAKLLHKDTVLTLRQGDNGSVWLWTLSPWLTSLETLLARANDRGDVNALGETLRLYVNAALNALECAHSLSVNLSVAPSCFGRSDKDTYLLDDEPLTKTESSNFGEAIVRYVDQMDSHSPIAKAFFEHLTGEFGQAVSTNSLDRSGLRRSLKGATPATKLGRKVQRKLLQLLVVPRRPRDA